MSIIGISACSEGEIAPSATDCAIRYSVNLSTRADKLHDTKSDISQFYVKAFTNTGASYIDCDLIQRQSDGSYATADGFCRYWPAAGTQLAFFAAYGAEPQDMAYYAEGEAQGVKLKYTVNSDIDEQHDLLVANTGAVTTPEKGADGSAPVNFTFRHALSLITLCARNVDPAIHVEISGIGLKHIQPEGILTAPFTGTGTGTFSWSYDELPDQSKPTYTISLGSTIVLAKDSAVSTLTGASEQYKYAMMMIPQTLNPYVHPTDADPVGRQHGSSIMVRANIWNVAGSVVNKDTDRKVWGINTTDGEWMMIPLGGSWLPGMRYTYTLTFGREVGAGGYNADESEIDKERVFDPIGFTVDIQPWIPGGDIVQNIY